MIMTSTIMNSRATRTPYILSAHTVDTGVILIQDFILTDVLSLLIIEHFPEEDVTLAWENQWRSWRSIPRGIGEAIVIPGPHVSTEVSILRYTEGTVSVTRLRLLLRYERSNQKERAFVVYGIGLEGFDNRTKFMSEHFQCCV